MSDKNLYKWSIAVFAIVLIALKSCSKDEIPTPAPQYSTIQAVGSMKDTFVPDTIIPYEYYTRTTYFSWAQLDSVWRDTTILQVQTITIDEWLLDGHYFLENRKDTLIIHPTNASIYFADYWDYWYLDD